jgi:hypothetical protein
MRSGFKMSLSSSFMGEQSQGNGLDSSGLPKITYDNQVRLNI